MRTLIASIGAVAVLTSTSLASAQETSFGTRGDVSLNSTSSGIAGLFSLEPSVMTPFIAFGHTSYPTVVSENANQRTEGKDKRTTFLLNPGIDVFVIDHLSIGGEVLFGSQSTKEERTTLDKRTGATTTRTDDGPSTTLWGFMPRVGYNIPIGRHFSIWPRGGIGFVSANTEFRNNNIIVESTRSMFVLYADCLFNWHPHDKFFVGVGPGFTQSLSHSINGNGVTVTQPALTSFRFLGFTIGGVLN
jgi:hypothetical protein